MFSTGCTVYIHIIKSLRMMKKEKLSGYSFLERFDLGNAV